MLALLALQPPGFGTFAEPAPAVPGKLPGRMTYSAPPDSSDTACSDYGEWKDYEQYNCVDYATNGWCPMYEDDASAEGIKAKDACCACGGGITDADETCGAIGYKPDDGLGEACESIGYKQEDLAAQDLAAQVSQLKAQSAQTNELLTQRIILELMSAKAAGAPPPKLDRA